MKTMKKNLVRILLSVCLFALAVGALLAVPFKTKTVSANTTTTFTMKDGASVRAGAEDGKNGIRFMATMTKDEYDTVEAKGGNYGVLIAPRDWTAIKPLNEANVFGADAVYTWTNEAGKANIVNMTATKLSVDPDDNTKVYISGSLVDVKTENLTREFEGVAYYSYTEGTDVKYVFANATDNIRSMVYVAQVAYESEETDADVKAELKTDYIDAVSAEATNYTVEHYQQNADLKGYTKVTADTQTLASTIHATVTATPKTYTGFAHNAAATGAFESDNALANDRSVLKVYYDRDTAFYNAFDVANMTNFTITTEGTASTLTALKGEDNWIQSKESGNAFIAKMDFTYKGEVSDNGAGFRMVDKDGNSINFMLVTWDTAKLVVNYNNDKGRAAGLPLYSYVTPAVDMTVQQTLTYANGVFTLWENDNLRNAFTLDDLVAKWGTAAEGLFTADEEFYVGYNVCGAGNNGNGVFQNMSVEFITDEAKKEELTAWYTYMTETSIYQKPEQFFIHRTGDGYAVDESAITYTANGVRPYRMYTKNSANAFEIEATFNFKVNDHGVGFSVKDTTGMPLNFMFVEWAGTGDLCIEYNNSSANRWNVDKQAGETVTPTAGPMTVTLKMKYYNGVFMIYEKSGTSYKLRNYISVADIETRIAATAGIFAADEALQVGLYGYNGGVPQATVSNLSVNMAVTDAWKQEFNYFTEFNEASLTNFTASHTDTATTLTALVGEDNAIQTRNSGNAFVAKMDFTYKGNFSDNGAGFRMVDKDGNSINFMLVTWDSAKLVVNYNNDKGRAAGLPLYDYVEPASDLTVQQTLTYYNGVFTLWENDKLRNMFTLDDLVAKWGTAAQGLFTADEEFYVGYYVCGAGSNGNGAFSNASVEFVTDQTKKEELNAKYNEMQNA